MGLFFIFQFISPSYPQGKCDNCRYRLHDLFIAKECHPGDPGCVIGIVAVLAIR